MSDKNETAKKPDRIKYWLDISQYDMDTAEAMLKAGRLLYVGFMCHQAIEKILKACFVKNREGTPPFIHNLRYLASEIGIYEMLSEEYKNLLDMLEPLNIESRYPDYKKRVFESLTKAKSKKLLIETKGLRQWLQNQL
jgi:HEPN domain-containing protein